MGPREAAQVLGITEDEAKDVKLAERKWKRLMMQFHPDRQGGSAEMAAKLNEAIDVIRNGESFVQNIINVNMGDLAGFNVTVADGHEVISGFNRYFDRSKIIQLLKTGESEVAPDTIMRLSAHGVSYVKCTFSPTETKTTQIVVDNGVVYMSPLHNYECLFVVLIDSDSKTKAKRIIVSWPVFQKIMEKIGVVFKIQLTKFSV
jgi:hypothetical protein